MYKGSFNNYVDMILPFFAHLPTSTWTFFTLNVDQNWHFLSTYPPHLVHVIFEKNPRNLMFHTFASRRTFDTKLLFSGGLLFPRLCYPQSFCWLDFCFSESNIKKANSVQFVLLPYYAAYGLVFFQITQPDHVCLKHALLVRWSLWPLICTKIVIQCRIGPLKKLMQGRRNRGAMGSRGQGTGDRGTERAIGSFEFCRKQKSNHHL